MMRSMMIFYWFLIPLLLKAQTLFPVRSDGKWSMMNKSGEIVSEEQFDAVSEYYDDRYAIVKKGAKLGVIDSIAQLILPFEYNSIGYIERGFFNVRCFDKWMVVNDQNRILFEDMSGNISFLNDQFLVFEDALSSGLAHVERGIILPANYSGFELLNDTLIIAFDSDNKKTVYNLDGEKLINNRLDQVKLKNGVLVVNKDGKWGLHGLDGQRLLVNQWEDYDIIDEKHIDFSSKQRNYLFSLNSYSFIDTAYAHKAFDERYILKVSKEGQHGLIDKSGKKIMECLYEQIIPYFNCGFKVYSENKIGLLNKQGRLLLKTEFDVIEAPSNEIFRVGISDKYGFYHISGKVVLPVIYDQKSTVNNNVIKLVGKEGHVKLLYYDQQGELVSDNALGEIKTLRIVGKKNTYAETRSGQGALNNQINDTLQFIYHPEVRKWGIWNFEKNQYRIPPTWDKIRIHEKLGFTMVFKEDHGIGGKIPLGEVEMEMHGVAGLVNNAHGLPISKMEFLHIFIEDFEQNDYARCILVGGKYGMIAKSGKILHRNFTFIDEFVEGKALVNSGGKMYADLNESIKRPLPLTADFFLNMDNISGFSSNVFTKAKSDFTNRGKLICSGGYWTTIDTNAQLGTKFNYDFLTRFYNDRAMYKIKGKWGIVRSDGKVILQAAYDNIDFVPKAGKSLFYLENNVHLTGMIDSNAKVKVPVEFAQVKNFREGMAAVKAIYGKWGFVDNASNLSIKPTFRLVHDFKEDLSVVYQDSKWGAINKKGKFVIDPQYIRMGDFSEGLAWVYLPNGYKGYINKKNELIFSLKLLKVTDFKSGVARVKVNKKGWGLIDKTGVFIMKPKRKIRSMDPFDENGLSRVRIGNKYRLINLNGSFVTKGSFDVIRSFNEGRAIVRKKGVADFFLRKPDLRYTIMDTTGELITQSKYRFIHNFKEGRAIFKSDESRYGFLDLSGEEVIKAQYIYVTEFDQDRSIVFRSAYKTGLIDRSGKVVIPTVFDKIVQCSEATAVVKVHSKSYFYIDENSKRITPFNYNGALKYYRDVAPVRIGQKWGVVTKNGLTQMYPKYGEIENFENGLARVKLYRKYGLADVNGHVILEPDYDYINFVGSGLFRIEKGDEMGYMNKNGKWIKDMQ